MFGWKENNRVCLEVLHMSMCLTVSERVCIYSCECVSVCVKTSLKRDSPRRTPRWLRGTCLCITSVCACVCECEEDRELLHPETFQTGPEGGGEKGARVSFPHLGAVLRSLFLFLSEFVQLCVRSAALCDL